MQVAKKKKREVSLPVSRTNLNRVKYHTHTLGRVLELEGYVVQHGRALVRNGWVSLPHINIHLRQARVTRLPKEVTDGTEELRPQEG